MQAIGSPVPAVLPDEPDRAAGASTLTCRRRRANFKTRFPCWARKASILASGVRRPASRNHAGCRKFMAAHPQRVTPENMPGPQGRDGDIHCGPEHRPAHRLPDRHRAAGAAIRRRRRIDYFCLHFQ